ncbi:hypothetical protein [Moorena sp. SIO1G6]|nr:hypothetical protein [Moorena sp. SIO1G6]
MNEANFTVPHQTMSHHPIFRFYLGDYPNAASHLIYSTNPVV